MSMNKLQEIVKDRETWCASVHGVTESDTLSDWTTTMHFTAVIILTCAQLCPWRLIPVASWVFLYNPSSFGEGNGTPLQYSCLENPMDGGAWWAAVHGVAKSWTRLSDFTFTFHFPALEKEMAPHSSVLAWRIPGTGEPGGWPSMGSHRVGHDWSDLAAVAAIVFYGFLLFWYNKISNRTFCDDGNVLCLHSMML